MGSCLPSATFGFGFLTSPEWNPVTDEFGALVPINGTLVTSGIALADRDPGQLRHRHVPDRTIAPLAAPPARHRDRIAGGIPSIIYGMWGLFVFAPLFADHVEPWLTDHIGTLPFIGPFFSGPPMGIGMLTAGIILAIMVIPFIASVMRDVFDVVPAMLKESAYGLGATTWEVMWNVVLPYTKIGVVGGIMLGLGRALGETMAVTFVIGNAHRTQHIAAHARQQHRLGAGQRIHRSGRRSVYLLADRTRPDPVLHHIRRPARSHALHAATSWRKREGHERLIMLDLYTRRRIINAVSLSISVLAMLFGLFWLGWILWTLLVNGLPGLSCARVHPDHAAARQRRRPAQRHRRQPDDGRWSAYSIGTPDRHPGRHLSGRIRPARLARAGHPLHQRHPAVARRPS